MIARLFFYGSLLYGVIWLIYWSYTSEQENKYFVGQRAIIDNYTLMIINYDGEFTLSNKVKINRESLNKFKIIQTW